MSAQWPSLCQKETLNISLDAKSLVPYRQRSARRSTRLPMLWVRSGVDTAICSKPLARWMYGDWMLLTES